LPRRSLLHLTFVGGEEERRPKTRLATRKRDRWLIVTDTDEAAVNASAMRVAVHGPRPVPRSPADQQTRSISRLPLATECLSTPREPKLYPSPVPACLRRTSSSCSGTPVS